MNAAFMLMPHVYDNYVAATVAAAAAAAAAAASSSSSSSHSVDVSNYHDTTFPVAVNNFQGCSTNLTPRIQDNFNSDVVSNWSERTQILTQQLTPPNSPPQLIQSFSSVRSDQQSTITNNHLIPFPFNHGVELSTPSRPPPPYPLTVNGSPPDFSTWTPPSIGQYQLQHQSYEVQESIKNTSHPVESSTITNGILSTDPTSVAFCASPSILSTPLSDDELAREMQIVDDILRSAAEEIFEEVLEKSKMSREQPDEEKSKMSREQPDEEKSRSVNEEEETGSEFSSLLTHSQSDDDELFINIGQTTTATGTECSISPTSERSSSSSLSSSTSLSSSSQTSSSPDSCSERSFVAFDSLSTSPEEMPTKSVRARRQRSTNTNIGQGRVAAVPQQQQLEDRKLRKKEQNKNAATRYRQKKKQEMEDVAKEEQELLQRNQDLHQQYTEHLREEKYLKKLIREMYRKL